MQDSSDFKILHILAAAAAVALLLAWLAGSNLGAQGLYYDELHQAPAAFSLVGKHPTLFTYAPQGVPLLNLSYIGAIKSNIYGLYLRFVNPQFTVESWRWVGIVFTASGVFIFYLLAGGALEPIGCLVFTALILTDVSVLLMSRHDWGPVALSLCLRLVFIGLWISLASGSERPFRFFIAGLLAGVAVFEKLSGVVLIFPLLLMAGSMKSRRAWTLSAAGLVTGLLPLVVINARSYWNTQSFLSLSAFGTLRTVPELEVLEFADRYLSLALGGGAQELILGEYAASYRPGVEALLLLAALCAAAMAPAARAMIVAYAGVGILVLLLPAPTSIHHWILGTPFQYAAIAWAAPLLWKEAGVSKWKRPLPLVLGFVLAAIVVNRVPNSIEARTALVAGKFSQRFNPAFTDLGRLAAKYSGSAAFISADWGTATQLYCLSNGEDDLSYEPYWRPDPADAVMAFSGDSQKTSLYVITAGIRPDPAKASARVLEALTRSTEWAEAPLEPEFAALSALDIRKFVRISVR